MGTAGAQPPPVPVPRPPFLRPSAGGSATPEASPPAGWLAEAPPPAPVSPPPPGSRAGARAALPSPLEEVPMASKEQEELVEKIQRLLHKRYGNAGVESMRKLFDEYDRDKDQKI